jgi:hypothetical protein
VSTAPKRVILLELSVADVSIKPNNEATELVVERVRQIRDDSIQIRTDDNDEIPLIESDKRDLEAEQRIAERAGPLLQDIAERADRARKHISEAIEEALEATRVAAILAHLRAEALLASATSDCFEFVGKCIPDSPDVIKTVLKKVLWVVAVKAVNIVG